MKKYLQIACIALIAIGMSGCAHHSSVPEAIKDAEKLTVGTVQREIKVGMSQSDVASVLGSPNIVTSEGKGKETWIYDKINSRVSYDNSNGYGTSILLGGSQESGNVVSSQESLTIIIKFVKGKVEEVKYHASRF